MNDRLQAESARLTRSWMQHDQAMLRDYLVAEVEDPRLNVSSILSRHFLAVALFGDRFQELLAHELRFAATMNWLARFCRSAGDPGERHSLLHALRRGADNAEGTEIPSHVTRTFAALPASAGTVTVPNYLEVALARAPGVDAEPGLDAADLNTFMDLWRRALPSEATRQLSVLEPACGSANDYRFMAANGLARFLDYTGFDLCEKNVENARALFPGVRFELGNVFEIAAPDQGYDCCVIHDLFEHLSPEGLDCAIREVGRVTRLGLCVGFFNMDEIPEHVIQPVNEYHWNTLSLERVEAQFAACGFRAQVINIGSYLRWRAGCPETHNPNAYTLVLGRGT